MWFFLPLIIFILCCVWWWTSLKKVVGISTEKIPKEIAAQMRPAEMPYDQAAGLVLRYANVFRTQNLASVFSLMSDVLYHTVSETIKGLNRIGVRKELYFAPYPKVTESDGLDYTYSMTVLNGGKADTSATMLTGDYSERYIDSATETLLFSSEKKNADINVSCIRSAVRTEAQAQPIYCTGCGMQIDTGGEIFICKHCGATYRSDSFDWVASNIITPTGTQAMNQTGIMRLAKVLSTGFFFGGPVLILLGLFAGNFLPLKILIGIACVAMPCIIFFINSKSFAPFAGFNKALQYDRLASVSVIAFRSAYLLKRLYSAHDHNPGDMRTLMDAEAFSSFTQVPHSGTFVLDMLSTVGEKSDFYVRDGRQYLEFTTKVFLLVLTPQRTATVLERNAHVVMYRNERTRYEYLLNAQDMRCPGCGSSLNLTAHGACKVCGTEFDVADFDWKIAHIDPAAFA